MLARGSRSPSGASCLQEESDEAVVVPGEHLSDSRIDSRTGRSGRAPRACRVRKPCHYAESGIRQAGADHRRSGDELQVSRRQRRGNGLLQRHAGERQRRGDQVRRNVYSQLPCPGRKDRAVLSTCRGLRPTDPTGHAYGYPGAANRDADTDRNAQQHVNPITNRNQHSGPHPDQYAIADRDQYAIADRDQYAHRHSDIHFHARPDEDRYTGSNSHENSHKDANSQSHKDANTHKDPDSHEHIYADPHEHTYIDPHEHTYIDPHEHIYIDPHEHAYTDGYADWRGALRPGSRR
jgi:hypothetical protein